MGRWPVKKTPIGASNNHLLSSDLAYVDASWCRDGVVLCEQGRRELPVFRYAELVLAHRHVKDHVAVLLTLDTMEKAHIHDVRASGGVLGEGDDTAMSALGALVDWNGTTSLLVQCPAFGLCLLLDLVDKDFHTCVGHVLHKVLLG
jgi:hypothetical protein